MTLTQLAQRTQPRNKIRIALAVHYLVQYRDDDPNWWHAIEAYALKSELLDLVASLDAPSSGSDSPFEYLIFPDEEEWRTDSVPAPLPTAIRLSLLQTFDDGSSQRWESIRDAVRVVAPLALEELNRAPDLDGQGWETVGDSQTFGNSHELETFAALHNRRMRELLPESLQGSDPDYVEKLRTALETGGLVRFDEQCLRLPAGHAAHVFTATDELQRRCTNRPSLLGLMGCLGEVAGAEALPSHVRIVIDEVLLIDLPAASAAVHKQLGRSKKHVASQEAPIEDIEFPGGLERYVYASWSWMRADSRIDTTAVNGHAAMFSATRAAFPRLDPNGQESVAIRIYGEENAPVDVRLVSLIEGELIPYFPGAPSVQCFTPRRQERARLSRLIGQTGELPPVRLVAIDANARATIIDSNAQLLSRTLAWDEAEAGGLPRVYFEVSPSLKAHRAALAIVVASSARQGEFTTDEGKRFEYSFAQPATRLVEFEAVEVISSAPMPAEARVEVGSLSTVRFEPANSFERIEFEVLARPRVPDLTNAWEVLRFNDLWSMVAVRAWRQSGTLDREALTSHLTSLLPGPDPRTQDQQSPDRHYRFAARRRESSPEVEPRSFEAEQIARRWQSEAGRNTRFGFIAEDRYGRRRALGGGSEWDIAIPAFPVEACSLAAVRLGGQDSRPLMTWAFDAQTTSVLLRLEFSALRRDAADPLNPSLSIAAWRAIAEAALAQATFLHIFAWRAANQGLRYELASNEPELDFIQEDCNPFQDQLVFQAKVDITASLRSLCESAIPPNGVAPSCTDAQMRVALHALKDQKNSQDPITPFDPTYANGHVLGVMLEVQRAEPHDPFTGAQFRTLNGPRLEHPYDWFNASGALEAQLLNDARRRWRVARVPVVAGFPLFDEDQLPGLLGQGLIVDEQDTRILFSRAHLSDIPGYRPVPDAVVAAMMAVAVAPPPAADLLTDHAWRVLTRLWEAIPWATNWPSPRDPATLLAALASAEPQFLELARTYLKGLRVAHESRGDVPLSVLHAESMLLSSSLRRLSALAGRDFMDRRRLDGRWPSYFYIDLQSKEEGLGINPDLHLCSVKVAHQATRHTAEFMLNACRRSLAFSSGALTFGRLFPLPQDGFIAIASDPKTTRFESLLEPDSQVPSVSVASFEGPNSAVSTPARVVLDLPSSTRLRSPSLIAASSVAKWVDPRLFEQKLTTELNQPLSLEALVSGDIVRAAARSPTVEVLALASQAQAASTRGDSVGVVIAEIDVDPVAMDAQAPWCRDMFALLPSTLNPVDESDLRQSAWWSRLAGDAAIDECWQSVINELKDEVAAIEELAALASTYAQRLNLELTASTSVPLVEFSIGGSAAAPVIHIHGVDYSLVPAVTVALLRLTRVAQVSSYAVLIGIHHSVFRQRNCVLEHRRDQWHAEAVFNIADRFAQRRSLSAGSLLSATGLKIDASRFSIVDIPRSVAYGLDFVSRALAPITDQEGTLWSAYGWLLDSAHADHPEEILLAGTLWVSKRVPLPVLGSDGTHQHSSDVPASSDWVPAHRFDGTRSILESSVWPQLRDLQYGSGIMRVDVAFFRPKALASQSQWSATPFLEVVGRPVRWVD